MTKKESLEDRVEAVLYMLSKYHGISREQILNMFVNDQTRWKRQAQDIKAREQVQAREKARKQKIIDEARKNPPKCPKCGSPSRFFEAAGLTGQFMDALRPGDYWWVEFDCQHPEELHRHRFKLYPDAPDESKNIVIDPKDIAIEEEES